MVRRVNEHNSIRENKIRTPITVNSNHIFSLCRSSIVQLDRYVCIVSHFLERRNWERVCIQSLRVHRDDSTEHLGLHLGDIALVQPRHIPSHYSVLRKRLHWRIILAFLFKRIHFQGRISRIMTIKENTTDYFLLLCKHELIKLCNATLAVPW